jgi:hypothetical protein
VRQLRQEAGRRGWKWAFGAAWTQRGRLLAEAERNRWGQGSGVLNLSDAAAGQYREGLRF